MARGINKVILIDNLGQNPEVRFTQGGTVVANLNIATSDSWLDRNSGQRQECTEWRRVILFQENGRDCPAVFEEMQQGLHRRPPADAQMARPERARSLHHGSRH